MSATEVKGMEQKEGKGTEGNGREGRGTISHLMQHILSTLKLYYLEPYSLFISYLVFFHLMLSYLLSSHYPPFTSYLLSRLV